MSYDANIKLLWSMPKIYIPEKEVKGIFSTKVEKNSKWYVYYYYLNPTTNVLEIFKLKKGINKIDSIENKRKAIINLQKAVEIYLASGYNPFELKEQDTLINNLWTKPKTVIPAQNISGSLYPDTNYKWYIHYTFFNEETNENEFFKEIENDFNYKNLNERIVSLKKQRYQLEQRLINGYNPIEAKKTHIISNEEYKMLLGIKLQNKVEKFTHPHIFQNLKTEKIFHKILVIKNVIDENNKATKGFKSVAYNTFKTITVIKNKVFRTNILKEYAIFLNKKYNAGITDLSKFGSHNTNLIESIEAIIEQELKSN